tara:strand:+ start:492 stop:713 length:222 start_codon:yes stop_codon:yes gene_type:complete
MPANHKDNFYNYELQFKDEPVEKFSQRKDMIEKYHLTLGSIAQLLNDTYSGKSSNRRYKWKDFKIKKILEEKR